MKQFLWGVLIGIILLPILHMIRSWLKHRGERIDLNETEWP